MRKLADLQRVAGQCRFAVAGVELFGDENEAAIRPARLRCSPARRGELAVRAGERQHRDVPGVRFFGMCFERLGDRRQGVALAVGILGRLGGGTYEFGELFHPSRRAAAAFDAARTAGGQQRASCRPSGEHAEPIATDHAAAFVGDGVRGRRELDVAMHQRAESHQFVVVSSRCRRSRPVRDTSGTRRRVRRRPSGIVRSRDRWPG